MISKTKNLLIIGAGSAGAMVIDDFRKSSNGRYNIIGVIDDKKSKQGTIIEGVKVLGTRHDIEKICREKFVDEILVAIPSLSYKDKTEILLLCTKTGCDTKILPSVSEIMATGNMKIRDVQIEDLLEREPVVLNNKRIFSCIEGKSVLVTGGAGSIGSELCRQIAKYNPKEIIVFDVYENSVYELQHEFRNSFPSIILRVEIGTVRDETRLDELFRTYRPQLVFHAAAHKHVPLMEDNPAEAVKNNVFGTLATAMYADFYNVEKFIMISTDKAVNPTNVMGATKRLCEMIIQTLGKHSKTNFSAVRFGNVLGSNGSVIPLFKKQIKEGGPITLTDKEVTRYFMTVSEAAQLVLDAASYAKSGEIYVLDMGKPVRIYDLAVNLIRLSGLEPYKDVDIVITGLRPGEKLYEELLMPDEGLKVTANNKIYVASPLKLNENKLLIGLTKLLKASQGRDKTFILKLLSELVDTYKCLSQSVTRYYEIRTTNAKGALRKTADAHI